MGAELVLHPGLELGDALLNHAARLGRAPEGAAVGAIFQSIRTDRPREQSMENQSDRTVVFSLGVAIVAVMVAAYLAISFAIKKPATAGEFGDMFGGVNALFSGLAFVGVVYAILLQSRELRLQRAELTLTRNELEGQKNQLEAQNRTFRQQNFDNAFFRMLSLHHEIVNAIDIKGPIQPAGDKTGRDCFVEFYRQLGVRLETDARFTVTGPTHASVLLAYGEMYREYIQPEVGHYFRNLYNIIKFIDRADIQDKALYTNLVRAQLSSHELLLLFYNCASPLGDKKFKPLVERHALLKNMPSDELLDASHRGWYESSAYGRDEPTGT